MHGVYETDPILGKDHATYVQLGKCHRLFMRFRAN
jgi:hypothetical protein